MRVWDLAEGGASVVIFEATAALIIAAIVWAPWRWLVWRRLGGDFLRESGVAILFVWSLVVVRVVYFPMTIIFYDWHSRVNLIPFRSILQLIGETAPTTAMENIGGNILMFVPAGLLLPLLFTRLRSLGALALRAAVISAVIELTQVFTRARAIDVDDVILNVLGAMIGYVLFALARAMAKGRPKLETVLVRFGAERTSREPLLTPVVPILITLAVVLPMMLGTIVEATLADGPDGIIAYATEGRSDVDVVAREDIGEHTFVLTSERQGAAERLTRVDFERVLPGRFTWIGTGEMRSSGSTFSWSITTFNVVRGEIPLVVVWGSNAAMAAEVEVSGNGVTEQLGIPPGSAFVVGFSFDVDVHSKGDVLDDFDFVFYDRSGVDVTSQFNRG